MLFLKEYGIIQSNYEKRVKKIEMEQLELLELRELKKQDFSNACAFTGHRELEADFTNKEILKRVEFMIQKGVNVFYCGMAKGFDLVAGETVLKLKKKYKEVKLIACVPYYGQERGFEEKDKKRYAHLLKKCDEKVLLSESYYKGCLLARNRYMVDRSAYLIAYLKKDVGGTAYTVNYALKKGLEVVYIEK